MKVKPVTSTGIYGFIFQVLPRDCLARLSTRTIGLGFFDPDPANEIRGYLADWPIPRLSYLRGGRGKRTIRGDLSV